MNCPYAGHPSINCYRDGCWLRQRGSPHSCQSMTIFERMQHDIDFLKAERQAAKAAGLQQQRCIETMGETYS